MVCRGTFGGGSVVLLLVVRKASAGSGGKCRERQMVGERWGGGVNSDKGSLLSKDKHADFGGETCPKRCSVHNEPNTCMKN